jgi:hypothetical protein
MTGAAFVIVFTDEVLARAAASLIAGHAVAAVAGLVAGATEGPTTVRGVEIKGESTFGRATTLAALVLVLTRLLQAETARAEAFGVTQPFAAIAFRFTGLVGEGAAAVVLARLAVEEVLAAVLLRLATALGVVTARVALADAVAAAFALVATGFLRAVTTAVAGLQTVGRRGAGGITALVVVGIAGVAQGEAGDLFTGAVDTLAVGPARRAIGAGILDALTIGLATDAAVAGVIFPAAVDTSAGGADPILTTVA